MSLAEFTDNSDDRPLPLVNWPTTGGLTVFRLRPDADGRYAWDHWKARALEAGLNKDLAELGRAVMREAVQHGWDDDLQQECGWQDEGGRMLVLAVIDGCRVKKRWEWLLETDGERGLWNEQTGDWEPFLPRRRHYGR